MKNPLNVLRSGVAGSAFTSSSSTSKRTVLHLSPLVFSEPLRPIFVIWFADRKFLEYPLVVHYQLGFPVILLDFEIKTKYNFGND